MAVAFAQSMRALAADRGRWSLPGLLLVCALLGGWGAWFVGARVAVYEVTQTARLEVDQAGASHRHPGGWTGRDDPPGGGPGGPGGGGARRTRCRSAAVAV